MDNNTLLNRYTAVSMELQEEYLKKPQDYGRQRLLQEEFAELKAEIAKRMDRRRV